MNTLVIVLIAAVCLFCGYTFYGRWLANKWGIDPKAKTPAVALEDGQDYVPTDGWTVFAHQFSSIAGAGPVTGAIQAAAPAGATTVEAPMPGKILNIKVSEGQAVKFGEVVVIMEAMKMETEIVAPADGTVSKILVKAGDSVDTGAALVALN